MLDITVDLVPFGNENERQKIGSIRIVNDGTGTERLGNYDVTVQWEDGNTKQFRETGFPRSWGWAALLYHVMETLEYEIGE